VVYNSRIEHFVREFGFALFHQEIPKVSTPKTGATAPSLTYRLCSNGIGVASFRMCLICALAFGDARSMAASCVVGFADKGF
jgi:hypothetical protein